MCQVFDVHYATFSVAKKEVKLKKPYFIYTYYACNHHKVILKVQIMTLVSVKPVFGACVKLFSQMSSKSEANFHCTKLEINVQVVYFVFWSRGLLPFRL